MFFSTLCLLLSATADDPGLRMDPPANSGPHRPVMVAPCSIEALAETVAGAARLAAEASTRTANTLRELLEQQAIAAGFVPATLPEISNWSYKIGLSGSSISGNASSYALKADADVEGHWRKWNTEGHLTTAYAETEPTTGPVQHTASRGEAYARGQRNYNPILGIYVLPGAMFDRVSNVAWQLYGESGLSLMWFEHKQAGYLRSRLRTSLGARYTREHRRQYYPTVAEVPLPYRNIYGPTLTGNFRFGLSRNATFSEDAELYQDAQNSADLRVTSATSLSAQINQRVGLTVSYKIRYYGNNGAIGRKTTDTELSAGLTWEG
jgi:hypothetical protein